VLTTSFALPEGADENEISVGAQAKAGLFLLCSRLYQHREFSSPGSFQPARQPMKGTFPDVFIIKSPENWLANVFFHSWMPLFYQFSDLG